jgi:signal transduction histidine kinase
METAAQETGFAYPPRRAPWRKSLFFRVVLLSVVLIVCLFAAVLLLSRYFFQEAAREMRVQASEIARGIEFEFRDRPGMNFEDIESNIRDLPAGFEIDIEPWSDDVEAASFTLHSGTDGMLTRVVQAPLEIGGRKGLLTAKVTIAPQTEILRAFMNRYVLAVMAVFLFAIALMIYIIARNLRPLTRLSESCSAISSGDLRAVNTRGASGEILELEETFNSMVGALREKELMEKKLRQAQRLSALGNLAAGVAHDVRNPLNAIKLLSGHALDSMDPEKDARALRSLSTIRDEVGRLEEIVSSFLSLARETELDPAPERIDGLLEECIRLFRKDAESREVDLVSELRCGETKLMVDRRQMIRAILNVMLNGMEACPPGGKVRLYSRLSDRACEIEIRDDGPGIPAEMQEKVFDPYFTSKPAGTGLGLSITRGIIEEHGGTIELYCLEGQGCQVLIALPLEKLRVS